VLEFAMYEAKAAYFDANVDAPWAAAEYSPEEMTKLERLFDHTGPLQGLKVLEPGCGTGRLTKILSDRVGSSGFVVALDISPQMVKAAKRRVGARSNVQIHLSPVESFPIKNEEYDLILCHQVFPHFENKEKALKILSSGLKTKGKFIVTHFINFREINDLHRKSGTAVEKDLMPEENEMKFLFYKAGLKVETLFDDSLGYLLIANKRGQTHFQK